MRRVEGGESEGGGKRLCWKARRYLLPISHFSHFLHHYAGGERSEGGLLANYFACFSPLIAPLKRPACRWKFAGMLADDVDLKVLGDFDDAPREF